MLRVGLTGDLGSGKSTVARMFAARGAIVLSSDDMGRAMMQPGEPVYTAIIERFGPTVLTPDGALDRRELARLAFAEGRVAELNAIVHPAVITEQARIVEQLRSARPEAIVIIESALIFSAAVAGEAWHKRFDRIVLVTAPENVKVARFVSRASTVSSTPKDLEAMRAEARRRLALQGSTEAQEAECLVIRNDDGMRALEQQVDSTWSELKKLNVASPSSP